MARENRRGEIVAAATGLFEQFGYAGTSVRQIAAEVGCTEAALYYHFPEGKRSLLSAAVARAMPDFLAVVAAVDGVGSLGELVVALSAAAQSRGVGNYPRLRWVLAEFPMLEPADRALIREQFLHFHTHLSRQIERFEPAGRAAALAWLLISTGLGARTLFDELSLGAPGGFDPAEIFLLLGQLAEGAEQ